MVQSYVIISFHGTLIGGGGMILSVDMSSSELSLKKIALEAGMDLNR